MAEKKSLLTRTACLAGLVCDRLINMLVWQLGGIE